MGRRRNRHKHKHKKWKGTGISHGNPSANGLGNSTSSYRHYSHGSILGQSSRAPEKPVLALPSASQSTWTSPTKRAMPVRVNTPGQLRFSPKAHAKLKWFRDRGSTEISGFGISKKSELLYVTDFITIKQKAGGASVEFDDDALNKYVDTMVQQGWHPSEVLRIWLHTHPGNSAAPSGTDMDTFRKVFGGADWSIMAILAKQGEFKGKVGFRNGPGGEIDLSIGLDLTPPFDGVTQEDYEKWEDEYTSNILTNSYSAPSYSVGSEYWRNGQRFGGMADDDDWYHGYSHSMNEHTEGFSKKKEDTKSSQPATKSGENEVIYSHQRAVVPIIEQTKIPEWGGNRRLASLESDEALQLVSRSVEQVFEIEEYTDGIFVLTDVGWYEYPSAAYVLAGIGDEIDSLKDIAAIDPIGRGDISWHRTSKGYAPYRITRHLASGEVVDLRDDEDVANYTLGGCFDIDEKPDETATKDTEQSGFAESETKVQTQEPSKTKTEIITVKEVEAAVGANHAGNAGTAVASNTDNAAGFACPEADHGVLSYGP